MLRIQLLQAKKAHSPLLLSLFVLSRTLNGLTLSIMRCKFFMRDQRTGLWLRVRASIPTFSQLIAHATIRAAHTQFCNPTLTFSLLVQLLCSCMHAMCNSECILESGLERPPPSYCVFHHVFCWLPDYSILR